MAYVQSSLVTKYSSAATSTTAVLPAHVSGDLLIAVFGMANTADDFGTPSGWTSIGSLGSGGCTLAAFYLSATSSSETNPTSSGHTSNSRRFGAAFVIKDAPTSTPIDTSAFGTASVGVLDTEIDSATGTTTVDNVLCLHVSAHNQWRHMQLQPGPMQLFSEYVVDGAFGCASAWAFQESPGAIETFKWYMTRNTDDWCSMVIPIKSQAAINPPRGDIASPCSTILYAANDTGSGAFPWTEGNFSSVVTAIDGITTNNASGAGELGPGINPFNYLRRINNSTANQIGTKQWALDNGPYDVSGKKVCFHPVALSGLYGSRIASLDDHGLVVGLRSGTNEYALFDAGGSDQRPQNLKAVVIDDSSTPLSITTSGGSYDSTDVQAFVAGFHNITSSDTRVALDQVHALNSIVIRGGTSSRKATWQTAKDIADSATLFTVEQLGAAFTTRHDIQVGNGSDPVYFETDGTILQGPANDYQFQATDVDVTLYGVSGDTIKINDPLYCSGTINFAIHASSTSAATWDFAGGLIDQPKSVTLRDIGADAYDGLTLVNFPEITSDGDMTGVTLNGCTTTQAITITGATEAALQTEINRFDRATFINSGTYGLKIYFTGTGDISLNAPTGLSVDELLYESDNSSALTIVVGSSGASFPSTNTAGSATGVTISNDKTLTLNIVDESGSAVSGCEVGLLERGTTTEVDHDNNTASGTYTYTYTYSSDTNIDIQVLKQGYEPYWDDTQTLGNADQSITVVLMSVPASQN